MRVQVLKKDGSKGFKFLTGINRSIIPSQVTKLAQSVQLIGIIRPVVVAQINFLDERGMYIIDGQHLFYALMRADLDIPYVVIEIKDRTELVQKIALLNASSKSWTMIDYLTAWTHVSDEYRKLQQYYNIYDFELCFLAGILHGCSTVQGGNTAASNRIKKGDFKISDEGEKIRLLDCLTDVFKVVPRMNRMENLYLCNEYSRFYREVGKTYNHAKFIQALAKKKTLFSLATQQPGKLVETFKKIL